jgi:hypothetical protein
LITTGSSQFAPLSNEREVNMALARLESLIDSATWYATPLGENETHGWVAGSKSPPLAALPPVQRLNSACRVSGSELIGGASNGPSGAPAVPTEAGVPSGS